MTSKAMACALAPNILPQAIDDAVGRAARHPHLFSKGRVVSMVQVLITYTNLDSIKKPVLFNRSKPASTLGVTTRTVDRLLLQLEDLGWLERQPQPRLDDGGWGVTSIKWAGWVLSEIFALRDGKDKWGNNLKNKDLRTEENRATKNAHLSSSPKGEVFQNKVVDDISLKTQPKKDNQPQERSRRIPVDLVEPMNQFGLTPSNVCWLMAKCKAKGMRLQHVMKATYKTLAEKGLRAREAVSWLMYMINLKRDYAYESRQIEEEQRVEHRTEKRKNWLSTLSRSAFVPGSYLPNGRVVAQESDGIVTLAAGPDGPMTASPAIPFVESLARNFPGWARKVLRSGPDVVAPDQSSVFAGHNNNLTDRKAESKMQLNSLKSILKRKFSAG